MAATGLTLLLILIALARNAAGWGSLSQTQPSGNATAVVHPVQPDVVGPAVLGPPLGPGYGFMAAVMDGKTVWCGGTLIANNVVLTAAHCLAYEDGGWWVPHSVRIGWADLKHRASGDEELRVARIVVHPRYKQVAPEVTEDTSDLALLVLRGRSRHAPVRLPRKGFQVKEGTRAWAVGYSDLGKKYGTTANYFYTKVHAPKVCASKYRSYTGERLKVTARTICTGGQDGKREGTCEGDSGGPLLYGDTPARYTQLGVLSWGLGPSPCAPGRAGLNWWASLLYPAHQAWLAQELKRLGHNH